jgi:molybdopterin molybdotransferase/putative molybdopterin biosynthesis protein
MRFDSITAPEALNKLFSLWHPSRQTEIVPAEEAPGRITAENVLSLNTLPLIRASSKDGFAVKSALFKDGLPNPADLKEGIDYVRADTGDDFDDAFDAVIPIEDMFFDEKGVLRFAGHIEVEKGMNIRPSGSTADKGDVLLPESVPVRPCDMGSLAIGGVTEIKVIKKPLIVFIPTGNELIPVGTRPQRGEMIDSNSVMSKYMLEAMGAEVKCLPIVRDIPEQLEKALEEALSYGDMIILNAGTSMGRDDFCAALLKRRGHLLCHGILTAPGRPMAIAIIDNKPVFNTSGPMIAQYNALDWCLKPSVAHFLGIPVSKHPTVKARLTADISLSAHSFLEILCRVQLRKTAAGYEASPLRFHQSEGVDWKGFPSGQFRSQMGVKRYAKGEFVEVELLYPPEFY